MNIDEQGKEKRGKEKQGADQEVAGQSAPNALPEVAGVDLSAASLPKAATFRRDTLKNAGAFRNAGLTDKELKLVTEPLPIDLQPLEMKRQWSEYQRTIAGLLVRMGAEGSFTEQVTRLPWITDFEALKIRFSLVPMLGNSLKRNAKVFDLKTFRDRLAGECCLMELSAAAGYRTFCFPGLVRGLQKSGKMRDYSSGRMFDTFEFLNTMMQYPFDHPQTLKQLQRANGLHHRYKVAGAASEAQRDLFKYIALNMFYIGPSMRPDLSPQERKALCGITVLVAARMGHRIEGSVTDLEEFISRFEDEAMFEVDDSSKLRMRAIKIAQASQAALGKFPVVSKARIHGYVPYRVRSILEID